MSRLDEYMALVVTLRQENEDLRNQLAAQDSGRCENCDDLQRELTEMSREMNDARNALGGGY